MFDPLPKPFDFPAEEARVLEFWSRHDVFAETLRLRGGAPRFVFYEGPPTANGLPHPGHCLTRAIKDLFPRYRTMRGFLVERKGGWDTHGLPVEREVCKELGIHTKEEIELYGVEKFNLRCIQSVFRYTREWEEMTRRLGYWVDLREAYVTYHQSYVESVWWSLKTLFERGVLYQGHKVVWWWAQGGTALSSGEVGEGYRAVDDPSVFVKFPLVPNEGIDREQIWDMVQRKAKRFDEGDAADDREVAQFLSITELMCVSPAGLSKFGSPELFATHLSKCGEAYVRKLTAPRALLVWTTTPWTLVSNQFAAVHPDLEYALVYDAMSDECLYIAEGLVDAISKKVKRELETLGSFRGSELLGLRYLPPFPEVYYRRGIKELPSLPTAAHLWDGTDSPMGELLAYKLEGGTAPIGWRITAADFVTIDSGTGLVHEAPAFGEVDFALLQKERERFENRFVLPVLCAVDPDGTFNADAPERYRGRWVKDCDKDIIRELRDERKTPWGTPLLYHQEQYRHDYPFCPQAPDDPLIQYARKSWFVRTSAFKDEFLKNNAAMNWLPEHIKEGRFGDFLRNNVDWALSRERYWGTPLPIWVCEKTGKMEAIGSFAELQAKPGATDGGYWDSKVAEHAGEDFPEHLRVHKPYIDEWTYDSPFAPGARMRRVPEVIDCWWDAGSMPFAQWGYPHAEGSGETLAERFPADFISEAIDQTRGWFYGLLAISTLLRDQLVEPLRDQPGTPREAASPGGKAVRPVPAYPLPFKTCIVLGHMMGEDGEKMSKKLRNYKEPRYVFDTFGADAMRWYFFSAQAPWTSTRFVEANIRDSQRDFLVRLLNVADFFNIYARIDGFDPRGDFAGWSAPPDAPSKRGELDRWILSELHATVREVRRRMDAFENFPAARRLSEFADALSNWYVRRARPRFWKSARDADKVNAYATLYDCLLTLSKLLAPFTPFFAETLYQNLTQHNFGTAHEHQADAAASAPGRRTAAAASSAAAPVSVHLCDYPEADEALIDLRLAEEMDLVREVVSLGRAARAAAKLKVRQPLALAEIVLANSAHAEWLAAHRELIAEELNIHRVDFSSEAEQYVSYRVVPNFKSIGAKFRDLAKRVKPALEALPDPAAARKTLLSSGSLPLLIDGQAISLSPDDVEIRLDPKPGWSAAQGRAGVVVVQTELTPELVDEGVVRELVHHVQARRKELDLPYEARIVLELDAQEPLARIVRRFEPVVRSECLVERIEYGPPAGDAADLSVEGHALRMGVRALH